MIKRLFISFLFLAVAASLSGCNRALVTAKEREMKPVSRTYDAGRSEAYRAAREAVIRLGYKIQKEDDQEGLIRTSWLSTKAGSHYVDLFDRKDYGTIGAYYRLTVNVRETDGRSEISIAAPVRSLVARVKSSASEENKVLRKIADLLRKDDFELTNVGASD